jgi:hypothetical protein
MLRAGMLDERKSCREARGKCDRQQFLSLVGDVETALDDPYSFENWLFPRLHGTRIAQVSSVLTLQSTES